MSPLLLENSNKTLEIPKDTESSTSNQTTRVSQVIQSIPKKSTNIKAQIAQFQGLQEQDNFTKRLLFRKIIKGFEEQESILANHELRIKSLEAQLEKARPKKRRRVRISPNSKFVNIQAIQEAQKEANEPKNQQGDSEEANLSDSTIDCIEVEGLINQDLFNILD